MIKWPDAERQQEIADLYMRDFGIPGVIGFIDGTHIRLAHSPNGDQDYFNRKSFASIQLQVENIFHLFACKLYYHLIVRCIMLYISTWYHEGHSQISLRAIARRDIRE